MESLRLSLIFAFYVGISLTSVLYGQTSPKIGAYYFDGWRSESSVHLTKSLKHDFKTRKPRWGWVTSSQNLMDAQINEAVSNHISFFSFCWFFKKGVSSPLNNALEFYLKSPNRKSLEFCLLISNHHGFELGPENWNEFTRRIIPLLKEETYLKVNQKPLIIFFSPQSLVRRFGSTRAVSNAFNQLKNAARISGIEDVSIAACVSAERSSVAQAERCGFNLLTGYNYHEAGLDKKSKEVPIRDMQNAEKNIWNTFKLYTSLKYIPVSTLNWDPRPWSNSENRYSEKPFFVGYSTESVFNSVSSCIKWLDKNVKHTTEEKIALLYAWNEYGEGAYLTPTDNFKPLDGVKEAIKSRTADNYP